MQQKIAIITGASRGLGRAVAEYLADVDYRVMLLARNEAALKDVCNNILKNGKHARYFIVDVTDAVQVKNCIDHVVTEFGEIDLLFNSAGILKHGTSEMPDADIEELIKINLNGAIYVAKYVAAQMKKQKHEYIINIASLGGKVAQAFAGIYAASKFGISGFSEALFKEMAEYNVKVTNICPSVIATDMTKGRKFNPEQMLQPSDITKTVGYLLSLSKNAIPAEICINCLPLTAKQTETIKQVYGLD